MSATFPPDQSGDNFEASATASSGSRPWSKQYSRTPEHRSQTFRDNLSALKDELDSLVTRAATLSDNELSEAYVKLMTRFSSIRFAAKGVAQQATKQFNQGVDVTTNYVKGKPLQSVAIATGVGLALGMLLGRR